MAEKIRFKPVITRIKLNPEQAVLGCTCYSRSQSQGAGTSGRRSSTCLTAAKSMRNQTFGPSGARS